MCVARHQNILVTLALCLQLLEEFHHVRGNVLQLAADKEFQVHQYLVVPATSRMDFLAYVAQLARQHQFHLRMYVLYALLNHKLAFLNLSVNVPEFSQKLSQLIGLQQPDAFQHGDVSHRAQHISLCQVEVHLAVTPDSKPLYLILNLKSFIPKLCHLFS